MEQKDIQLLQEQVRIQAAPLQLIKTEMGRIIAGQEKLIDRLLLALISDGHVLLEGATPAPVAPPPIIITSNCFVIGYFRFRLFSAYKGTHKTKNFKIKP